MPSRRLTLSVPQPCHEDWQAMSPQFQGRFCQNCSKTVVDFTMMSDAEVVNWFSQQKGHTCGRFSQQQLGRELVAMSAGRHLWTWRAAVLGLAAWLSARTVAGKDTEFSPATEQKQPTLAEKAYSLTAAPTPDSLLAIKGVVIDAQTKEGLPRATVLLKGTNIVTPTDVNGNFSLNIPEELSAKDLSVEFSFIGYMNCEKKLSELKATQLATIRMSSDVKGMLEAVVVGGAFSYKWYSPRGLYYKARNLFRK